MSKKTAQQIKQECEEKDRCVMHAEEIIRQARDIAPMRLQQTEQHHSTNWVSMFVN